MVAIDIKPDAFLFLEARSLMDLAELISLKSSNKFDHSDFVRRLSLLSRENGEPEPRRILHTFAEAGAIAKAAFRRVMRRHQVINIADAISGVTRSHQRFCCRSCFLP